MLLEHLCRFEFNQNCALSFPYKKTESLQKWEFQWLLCLLFVPIALIFTAAQANKIVLL